MVDTNNVPLEPYCDDNLALLAPICFTFLDCSAVRVGGGGGWRSSINVYILGRRWSPAERGATIPMRLDARRELLCDRKDPFAHLTPRRLAFTVIKSSLAVGAPMLNEVILDSLDEDVSFNEYRAKGSSATYVPFVCRVSRPKKLPSHVSHEGDRERRSTPVRLGPQSRVWPCIALCLRALTYQTPLCTKESLACTINT